MHRNNDKWADVSVYFYYPIFLVTFILWCFIVCFKALLSLYWIYWINTLQNLWIWIQVGIVTFSNGALKNTYTDSFRKVKAQKINFFPNASNYQIMQKFSEDKNMPKKRMGFSKSQKPPQKTW